MPLRCKYVEISISASSTRLRSNTVCRNDVMNNAFSGLNVSFMKRNTRTRLVQINVNSFSMVFDARSMTTWIRVNKKNLIYYIQRLEKYHKYLDYFLRRICMILQALFYYVSPLSFNFSRVFQRSINLLL